MATEEKNMVELEFVTLPKKDMYGNPWQPVWINKDKYLPGITYKVSSELAGEFRRIIEAKEKQDRKLLRPTQDEDALNAVDGHGTSSAVAGGGITERL